MRRPRRCSTSIAVCELLFRAHHRVRRHLAEVAREHRVAAALFNLLVGRGAARREGQVAFGDALGLRGLEVELLLDQIDVGRLGARADGRSLAVEVFVVRRLDRLGLRLRLSASACAGLGAGHGTERRVPPASFMASFVAGDRGRAALTLLMTDAPSLVSGWAVWAEVFDTPKSGGRDRALRTTRCGKVSGRRPRRTLGLNAPLVPLPCDGAGAPGPRPWRVRPVAGEGGAVLGIEESGREEARRAGLEV